jgi:anaerobic magnesium-protoporphyrin IX monomethyl ester cyclase
VLGGPHVTLAPESALISPNIDYGVRGECETMIAALAGAIHSRRRPHDLPGLIFRDNGRIIMNPVPELVEDLDSLPLPDKQLFERTVSITNDYMTMTTRGCIFNCTFCCNHAFKKNHPGQKYWRVRSVDSVIEELGAMLSRYRFRQVYFVCPLFPPDKNWVADFAEKYSKKIHRPFYCFGHINFFDREYASLLRAAGCKDIEFGIQTLNEEIRRGMLNRGETNEKLEEALSICGETGLHCDVDAILGLPGEKDEDYRQCIAFYSRFRAIRRVKTFYLTLFPGTDLLDRAIELGLLPRRAKEDIAAGNIGDYFHQRMVKSNIEEWKLDAFEKLLRLLPIAPKRLIVWLSSEKHLRAAARIPTPLVKFIELLNLVRLRDLRLSFYIRLFSKHIFLHIIGRRSA